MNQHLTLQDILWVLKMTTRDLHYISIDRGDGVVWRWNVGTYRTRVKSKSTKALAVGVAPSTTLNEGAQ